MEIWKPLKNFPSYNGSSEGRIMNIRTRRIMKTFANDRGYIQVCLRKNNRQYTVRVARVIAETFLGEHPGMDVSYKNGDRSDINIDNLEWRSRKDIARESIDSGRRPMLKRTAVRVIETGNEYETVTECAKDICCDRSEIFKYLAGQRLHVKGYHFERIQSPIERERVFAK